MVKNDYGTMITNSATIGSLYEWKLQHGVALVGVSDSSVVYVSRVIVVSGVANGFTRAHREILVLVLFSMLLFTCSAHFVHMGSLLFSRVTEGQGVTG